MYKYRANVMICGGTGCIASGGLKVKDALAAELKNRGLENEINIVLTGCNGFCAQGPLMTVYPEGVFYQKLVPEDMPLLVEEHFIKGRPIEKLMYKLGEKKHAVPSMQDIPFFNLQVLRALRNKGMIDAEKIDDYIARDGYMAAEALLDMTQQIVMRLRLRTQGRAAQVSRQGLNGSYAQG